MTKLVMRDPATHVRLECVKRPQSHPIFRIVPGGVETWEKGTRLLPDKAMQRTAFGRRG